MKKIYIIIIAFLFCTQYLSAQMVLTYQTTEPNTIIALPLNGTVDVTVDWGDGTVKQIFKTVGDQKHAYGVQGLYTVTISGKLSWFGGVFDNVRKNLVNVQKWDGLGLTSLQQAFVEASNLVSVPATLPTTITNLSGMFRYAGYFNHPIGNWNTTNVTDMSGMFFGAYSFNQPLENWNTANVTDMCGMFAKANDFNQPIGNWNTANVTWMCGMFSEAASFNQPIGNWNTAKVTAMWTMFRFATSFNQPIGNWNTAKVTDMSEIFHGATSFNQPIDTWNTANVTAMDGIFHVASSFNQPIGKWNTGNVTDMSRMFYEATSFNQPIETWNTVNVTNMSRMFYEATSFNQPIETWNTVNVTNMSGMFYEATSFNQPIESWNTVNVTDMNWMFRHASSFNQPIGSWNTSNVTDMSRMLDSATSFNQPIGNWNVKKVADCDGMFHNTSLCTKYYDDLLNGWTLQVVESGVNFDGGNSKYSPASAAARTILVTKGWSILDAGLGIDNSKCPTLATEGGQENTALQKITLYPNPSTGQITISSKIPLSIIHIYNAMGTLVYDHEPNGLEQTINLSEVKSGLYLLKIGSQTVTFRKE